MFSVIDIKASHWFEPSQAHGIFEFSVAVLPTRFSQSDRLQWPRT